MNYRMMKIFTIAASFEITFQVMASHNIGLNLKCQAYQVENRQPCGGRNFRSIKLQISNNRKIKNAYQEFRSYGGCYPVSDEGFGTIEKVKTNEKNITFNLIRKGYSYQSNASTRGISYEKIKATFNLETNELSLDTSSIIWFYQKPALLHCYYKK